MMRCLDINTVEAEYCMTIAIGYCVGVLREQLTWTGQTIRDLMLAGF